MNRNKGFLFLISMISIIIFIGVPMSLAGGHITGQAQDAQPSQAFFPQVLQDSPSDWIAFISERDGFDGDLFVIRPDGSDLQNLSRNPDCYESYPNWSPDGKQLAYVSGCGFGDRSIFIMDFMSRNIRKVSPNIDGIFGLDWSPDGRKIVYDSDINGNNDIFSIDLVSGEARQLTDDPEDEYEPYWSPDGSEILYNYGNSGNLSEVYIMNADGSGVRHLSTDPGLFKYIHINGVTPWSPDGKYIIYSSLTLGNWELLRINPDGTGVEQLTDNPGWDSSPAWSPDGNEVAYIAFDENHSLSNLTIMNADGSDKRTIFLPGDVQPVISKWSPDGKKIMIAGYFENQAEVFIINTDGTGFYNLSDHPGADHAGDWRP